jgi:hypothetical protein
MPTVSGLQSPEKLVKSYSNVSDDSCDGEEPTSDTVLNAFSIRSVPFSHLSSGEKALRLLGAPIIAVGAILYAVYVVFETILKILCLPVLGCLSCMTGQDGDGTDYWKPSC